jgi:prepilin-type processing-associated H-X9-DG protein
MFASGVTINVDIGGTTGMQQAQALYSACNSIPGTQTLATNTGYWCGFTWNGMNAWGANFNSYNHWNTPNKWSCISANSSDPSTGGPMDMITASSNHPGGVNSCFCDGSVHFIKDSINLQTWWGLGTRNMGEVIGSDQY